MGRNVHRNDLLQRLDVSVINAVLVVLLCNTEFLTDIAAQILKRYLYLASSRILKAIAVVDDVFSYILDILSELTCNVRHINSSKFENAGDDSVLDIGRGWLFFFLHYTFAEYICLSELLDFIAVLVSGFLVFLKREHIREIHIISQERYGGILVEVSVGAYKIIISLVQFVKQRFQPLVALIVCLIVQNIGKSILYGFVSLETFQFRVSLDLVGVHFKRIISTDTGNDKFAVFLVQFAYLLAVSG